MNRHGNGLPFDHREAKALRLAAKKLSRVPVQGDPSAIFDAISGCIPVVAGLIGAANPAALGAMSSRKVRLPDELFTGWMNTRREHLARVLGLLLFPSKDGDFWRDGNSIQGPLREGIEVLARLDHHGLGEGAGYKVLERPIPGRGTEHVMLALLTERSSRFPEQAGSRLAALLPPIRAAVLRLDVPLVASQPFASQLVEEQALGYICLSPGGGMIETNRRAHELVDRYATAAGLMMGRRLFADFVAHASARTARGRIYQLAHDDGTAILQVRAHALVKEVHALQEDAVLLVLQEWELPSKLGVQATRVLSELTPRQRQIAQMLVQTKHLYKQIAAELGLSEGTIRKHVEHIYRMTGVQSRVELTLLLR